MELMFSILITCLFKSLKQFLENNILDLTLFTLCPDIKQKESKIFDIIEQLFWSAFSVRIISLANNKCDMGGPVLLSLIGFQALLSTDFSIILDNLSMHRIKIYDIGSPCLVPLVGEKNGVLVPFARMTISLVVIQDMIRLISFRGNLKISRVSLIKLYSNLSKLSLGRSSKVYKSFFLSFFSKEIDYLLNYYRIIASLSIS